MRVPRPLTKVIESFEKLPGIGWKPQNLSVICEKPTTSADKKLFCPKSLD
jgi:recombinational DNA repair protein RecR